MDFKNVSGRMKKVRDSAESAKSAPKSFDPAEAYRLRGKMLGVLLRDARVSASRSIDDCARILRVTPDVIESWEYGDQVPSLPHLEILAYYLDIPVSHFWGNEVLNESEESRVDSQNEYLTLRNRMIGALLRQAREEAGMSLEALSEAAAVSVDQINIYEMGEQPLPMHLLTSFASVLKKNMDYFLEAGSHIGELLSSREQWKHFSDLPEDLRTFAANPLNMGYIEIALMLSKMPTDKLRRVGESFLNITM